MKKIVSLLLVVTMLVTAMVMFAGCGEEKTNPDFKIGFIFLHDENSTYDKNFLDAAKAATEELGLTADQVIFKTNVPEGNVS